MTASAAAAFELRGLEIHNNRMWRWRAVQDALEFCERFGLNALVFHQIDLIDEVVLPAAYFDEETSWERWPVRLATVHTRRAYMERVLEAAKARNVAVFLEVKELWFPEALVELFPRLRTAQGVVCPTDPFWAEFLAVKTRELLETLPGIAGLIVSAATRETKVSISTNACTCERCRKADPAAWYRSMIGAMHAELARRGKTLAIRDFAYTVEQQNLVLDAAAAVSTDIVAALKNVPHDFWPTFPDNPRIGQVKGLRQWIEYDVWGQYCGLGAFPVALVQDIRRRLRHCRSKGASGVWFRTDWEVLDEGSVFNSLNIANLIAGAFLARDADADDASIYRALADYGLHSPLVPESCRSSPARPAAADAPERLRAFMEASWSVMEKTLYLRGHVFQYSSRFHHSLEEVESIMFRHQGREKWDPASAALVTLTEENVRALVEEKRQACSEVARLPAILDPDSLGVPVDVARSLGEMLDLYGWYVRGFYHLAATWAAVRFASRRAREADKVAAREAIEALAEFRKSLERRLAGNEYPFYVRWMMDPRDLALFEADARKALG